MAKIENLTIAVIQELIHDQIKTLAQTVADTTGIKLESVSIDWFDSMGMRPQALNVKLYTSKGVI